MVKHHAIFPIIQISDQGRGKKDCARFPVGPGADPSPSRRFISAKMFKSVAASPCQNEICAFEIDRGKRKESHSRADGHSEAPRGGKTMGQFLQLFVFAIRALRK